MEITVTKHLKNLYGVSLAESGLTPDAPPIFLTVAKVAIASLLQVEDTNSSEEEKFRRWILAEKFVNAEKDDEALTLDLKDVAYVRECVNKRFPTEIFVPFAKAIEN